MGKRDVTDWTQKGNQNIKVPDVLASTDKVDKLRDLAGKAGLLMCAGAVIAVLAKAVKNGGLEEYQEDVSDSAERESDTTETDKTE